MYGITVSANSAIRCSPPPLKRLRKPRIESLAKFFWIALTASALTPGTGMCEPRRYSARMQRREGELLADLRDRERLEDGGDHGPDYSSISWAVPPALSMLSRASAEKRVRMDRERSCVSSPWASTLTGMSLARRQAGGAQRVRA